MGTDYGWERIMDSVYEKNPFSSQIQCSTFNGSQFHLIEKLLLKDRFHFIRKYQNEVALWKDF